ncbi:LysR family transcriptional regulator [Alkalihalobacillus oceani]|uniref:LysR family transcriptional regulator n=1 Tax=Halalkalibacter oceani TaxID=1653776 RepID=UPI00203E26B2|nr:LysR family transcriptional regulator [Halalkalibacter oceani]MCM3762116.1 LysR family transcriptional regulator [Halalkalibacter oceani]
MDLKNLKTFLVACDTLNFTKTAEKLQYAQSSVTAQIKSLEQELNLPLFERLGKKVVLTEAGHQLKQYAAKMVRLEDEARSMVHTTQSRGTLTIGAQESQCTYRLPALLKSFKAKYPAVHLIFKAAHSDELATKHLLDGEIDLAFIMDQAKANPYLAAESLLQERLLLISSPVHRFVEQETVLAEDLIEETILYTEKGCSYRTIFENLLYSLNVTPTNTLEFVSLEAIKKCVMANLGVAVLPEMVVEAELREGTLKEVPLNLELPVLTTQMVIHKDKSIPPQLAEFMAMARKVLQQF